MEVDAFEGPTRFNGGYSTLRLNLKRMLNNRMASCLQSCRTNCVRARVCYNLLISIEPFPTSAILFLHHYDRHNEHSNKNPYT